MKLMLQTFPGTARFRTIDKAPASATAWRLEAGGLVSEPRLPVARPTVFVPSEAVLLLAVELPLSTHRQRAAMLPFAIEDRIGQPEDEVHLALGPRLADKRYLAAVVSHATMLHWIALLRAEGLEQAALVPDVLGLPWGGEDLWVVDICGARALVRTRDGAGFAISLASLAVAWGAAGRPACRVVGGQAPDYLTIETGDAPPSNPGPLLDLRTGPYARRRGALPRAVKRFGWVAAGGLVAHATIAAADTYALQSLAERREQETRALVAALAPGRPAAEEVVDAATALLPAGEAGMPPSGFLPLLSRVAVSSIGAGTHWQSLNYRDRDAGLTVDVEADGVGALEAARNALGAAGLRVELDDVDVGADGAMRGRLRVAPEEPAL